MVTPSRQGDATGGCPRTISMNLVAGFGLGQPYPGHLQQLRAQFVLEFKKFPGPPISRPCLPWQNPRIGPGVKEIMHRQGARDRQTIPKNPDLFP